MPEQNSLSWKRIFAEGAAIVASILLAFAIDAWWVDRNEIERESRILMSLLAEIDQNQELLRQAGDEYKRRYMDALKILEYIDASATDIDNAQLRPLIRSVLTIRTFHLESGTLAGLLASGELSLIRNEGLRGRLAAWPSQIVEWSEEQDAVFVYVRDIMVPFLSNKVQLRHIGPDFAPFPDGESLPNVPTGEADNDSIAELITSVEFDNLMFRRAQGLWYAIRDGETLTAQLSEIDGQIREYISE